VLVGVLIAEDAVTGERARQDLDGDAQECLGPEKEELPDAVLRGGGEN